MTLSLVFAEDWSQLMESLGSLNARLLTELESCWRDSQDVIENQLRQIEALRLPDAHEIGLETYQRALEEAGRKLLTEPLSQWGRKRPYKRALRAVEAYDRGLEDLIRSLPEHASVNGPQAISLLSEQGVKGMRKHLARLRRKDRTLPLKAIVADELNRLSLLRLRVEGQYLVALTLATRQLRLPAETAHWALSALARGRALTDSDWAAQLQEVETSAKLMIAQAENALSAWRRWPEIMAQRLASRVLAFIVWQRKRKPADPEAKRVAYLDHWTGQRRGADTEIELEKELERFESRVPNLFRRGLESLGKERTNLLAELDRFIEWLRSRTDENDQEEAPAPKPDVVPALSRISELTSWLKTELNAVSESRKILSKFSVAPSRRKRLRKLRPREAVYKSFEQTGLDEITRALEDVESQHLKTVREISQAHEVVAFALETARSEQEFNSKLLRESIQNALSLLEFHRREAPDWRPSADLRITQALGNTSAQSRMIMSRDRLGAFAYLARQGIRKAIVIAGRNAALMLGKAFRRLSKIIQRALLNLMVYIGWKQAPGMGKVEVVTRPLLPQEFTVDLISKDLPAIYRRLFRFEAIQDPRFLVGREREMEAIAQARVLWEEQRPVAVIIVGQRGSGKTSLLNCALKRHLEGFEVVRGEFNQRVLTEPELHAFLANLVGADDPDTLETFLCKRRRVIILEELERTFLRQVGYYSAVKSLQRLITATCSSTLWILATNQIAFQFLDAAVSLGNSFSHRINAASAEPDDLRQAIMLRHILSGLRLQFTPPPPPGSPLARLKSKVRGQLDPETLFFNTLAEESAGVYRTAFDIWLGHIDTVQEGMLYMKLLAAPDLSPVIDALDLPDLFTLVAIMQHGSLMPEEHAIVFQKSLYQSRAQIDELLAREIIEQDPGRPGFRIRPEAMRVAKEALYRRNLL